MSSDDLDPRLRTLIDQVTAKRARVVIDHILEHGFITTEDLANYGYNHPPRAARDVREHGIPLDTYRVTGSDGRSIGAYRFGDPSKIQNHKLGGRRVLSKELRDALFAASGGRCFTCGHAYESRYLQIDHRVPYEVAGESADLDDRDAFMLLCGSCQRRKSWSCEHCTNWEDRDEAVCAGCYWVNPEEYSHVACEEIRRLDLTFAREEAVAYDRATKHLTERGEEVRAAMRRVFLETFDDGED